MLTVAMDALWWIFLTGAISVQGSTILRDGQRLDIQHGHPNSGQGQGILHNFLFRYENADTSYGENKVVQKQDGGGNGGYDRPKGGLNKKTDGEDGSSWVDKIDWDDTTGWDDATSWNDQAILEDATSWDDNTIWEDHLISDKTNSPLNGYHIHRKSQSVDHDFFKDEDVQVRSIRKYAETDRLRVEESLLPTNGTLEYDLLRNCPHGRHLLLITLLEGFNEDCWKPRCMGKINYYLPDSLKSPSQPNPPPGVKPLKDIVLAGNVLKKTDIINAYKRTAAADLAQGKAYSRFRAKDVAAVNSLAKLAIKFESFDSLLSFLVVLREICNREVFIEVLFLVIQVRSDVGFVVPNLQSIRPQSFFPGVCTYTNEDGDFRMGRMDYPNEDQMTGPVRTFSFKSTHRTIPRSDPESELWHIREDVMANSMHGIWHVLVSDPNAPWVMTRRGELFYHMHKQMICRYNADRLAVGMGPVRAYDVNDWAVPNMKGYRSNLGPSVAPGVSLYSPRPDNKRLPDRAISQLQFGISVVNQSLRSMMINGTRLYYANGIDHGISKFGDLVEPYPDLLLPDAASLLHNYGHVELSELSERANPDDFGGVMGFAQAAMRDPIFWRWHKFTDNFFTEYKKNLGPYTSVDLQYIGVEVVEVTATSGGRKNHLRTFTDFNTLELDVNLMRTMNGTILRYERLNHDPYVFTIRINSQVEEWVVGRIFLIPTSKIGDRDMLDVVVEMDKFNFKLNRGMNVINRRSTDSPLMSTGAPSLKNLQENLIRGISETEFNWGNCGWPIELALPRGNAQGQRFELFVMISKVHSEDQHRLVSWEQMFQTSWSWCGMRQGEGSFPDKSPMGFPFDRPLTLREIMRNHSNMRTQTVRIFHSG